MQVKESEPCNQNEHTTSQKMDTDTPFDLSSPMTISEREQYCYETANLRAERDALAMEIKNLRSSMAVSKMMKKNVVILQG